MFFSKKNVFVFLSFIICLSGCSEKQSESNKNPAKDTVKVEENSNSNSEESKLYPSINISSNQTITSPMPIEINSEGVWFGFEGELGTISLLDETNKALGTGIMTAKGEWMKKGPVQYTCKLTYNATKSGKGKLLIKNNNPSGLTERDKSFELPVRYTKTE